MREDEAEAAFVDHANTCPMGCGIDYRYGKCAEGDRLAREMSLAFPEVVWPASWGGSQQNEPALCEELRAALVGVRVWPDPRFVREWVKRLRSGSYRQGYGRLRRRSGEFCCLGVACDMGDRRAWRMSVASWRYDDSAGVPGVRTRDAMGLDVRLVDALTNANDSRRVTFPMLADWLEANLLRKCPRSATQHVLPDRS